MIHKLGHSVLIILHKEEEKKKFSPQSSMLKNGQLCTMFPIVLAMT